jgi:thiol-disulfide isomerase/thioredoxin
MSKWNKITSAVTVLLLAFASHPLFSQTDPAVSAALDEGKKFEQRHQLTSALDSYRKALKLSKGKCADCLQATANLQLAMELPKDAAASAAAWAAQAATPAAKADAEYLQAYALLLQSRQKPKPNDPLLLQADEVLKRAAADNPSNPNIHMLDGRILAVLKKDDEAKSEFAACAANSQATPADCLRAKNFANDVSLARGELAPRFSIAKADGSAITLDSLAGKVVLIDFWATWCPACVKDLDYIQSIAEEFDKDRFVLLGVSSDEDEAKWKRYLADNRMIGLQVRDSNRALSDLFHISGIPTYVVLDVNGMVQMRVTGAEGDLRAKIRSLMAKPAVQTASIH